MLEENQSGDLIIITDITPTTRDVVALVEAEAVEDAEDEVVGEEDTEEDIVEDIIVGIKPPTMIVPFKAIVVIGKMVYANLCIGIQINTNVRGVVTSDIHRINV